MKRSFVVLLFICFSTLAFSQEKQVLQVLEEQRQAWNRGDIEEYMQGYWQSDSLLFVGKSGPPYGWKATLDNYKKSYPGRKAMGTLIFEIREVRILDSSNAFVLGKWHLKREKDEPQGYFTLLFKKFGDSWKVVVDHTS